MSFKSVFFAMLIGDGNVEPTIGKVLAGRDGEEPLARVPILADSSLRACAYAFEVTLHHEVDDAAYAVGAING